MIVDHFALIFPVSLFIQFPTTQFTRISLAFV